MSIEDSIRVNTRYTRSTNVERDRNSQAVIEAYLPTTRGKSLLADVSESFAETDQPRAWSLIGPYGSGKSSFALFLNELLSGGVTQSGKASLKVLRRESDALAKPFRLQSRWCRVALTGSAEPLSVRLLAAIEEAAIEFWADRKGRKPAILKTISELRTTAATTNEILELIDALQTALEKSDGGGLLIVVDELGKFLEYEARHYGANDIFLLQGLAERAYKGRKANLLLFVLLHQSFDLYARGLGESLKNEWAKVQGRFQSVPFVETVEQTLRVVAAAFEQKLSSKDASIVSKQAQNYAGALAESGGLPGLLSEEAAADLFQACYPIHPVALLTLPVLCQKFAQNERTLFSYLGSQEPNGFRRSISKITEATEWVGPNEVYDYFIQNQPAVLSDPLTHRRWAEVVTAVERAEALGDEAQILAKSIGLLNLISSADGLKATRTVVGTLLPGKKRAVKALKELTTASVVQFRRFSQEYRVWQGTDFNIDEATHLEAEKLGRFDLAETLSQRFSTAPVIARRHSVEKGSLRYFEVTYIDATSLKHAGKGSNQPEIVFFLSEGQDDERIFEAYVKDQKDKEVLWVLYRNGSETRSAIQEVLALEGVQRGTQELSADPVASRELSERLKSARIVEEDILNSLAGDPSKSAWYWQGTELLIESRRALQKGLSRIMDAIFDESPVIRNELINRDKLSSQAAAARNKLFQHMLDNSESAGLGIEKYPPERSIYRSILEVGGLHVSSENGYGFIAPVAHDPLNLTPTWAKIDAFFADTEQKPVAITELMAQLGMPPFGVKTGVFPVLFLLYYLLNKHELAVYEEGRYSPSLTYEHLERMVRRPGDYAFQRFRIEGVRADLFDEYSKALYGEEQALDMLAIARPLTSFMLNLDDYTKKTKRLSDRTLTVRQAFFLSKSPEKLLLNELPSALSFDGVVSVSGFAEALIEVLRELKQAQENLCDGMRSAFCEVFGLRKNMPLQELRTVLHGRSHGLDRYTVDTQGLKSFIRRTCDGTQDDEEWFSKLLLFLGQKPTTKWADQDHDTAVYRLAEFARRLLDLEKLRLHHETVGSSDEDIDIILLKSLRKNGEEIDEIVSINGNSREAIKKSREQIEGIIRELGDRELALALVAEVTHEFLNHYRGSNSDVEPNRTERESDAG